ncbi:MAG: EAL domain-containing protein [Methylobacteriaceae bacterium]|nr:EAL domain-containing protein [Methylobacteriaceae bacterium]
MRIRSLRVIVGSMGLAASLSIAAVIPIGYAVVAHIAEAGAMAHVAELSATRAARYIYQHGAMWTFHRLRLVETIALPPEIQSKVRQRLYDARGRLVAEVGDGPAWPTSVTTKALHSRDETVGRLEVEASLRPLLARTGLAALFAALLAGAVYVSFRRLPLRALDQAVSELEQRERELQLANGRFGAALASMPVGLSMFGPDHRLALCNDRYVAMYDLPAEVAQPGVLRSEMMKFRAAAGNAPADRAGYEAWIADLLRRREPATGEWKLDDGRIIRLGVAPVAESGMIAMHEDVTAINEARARIAHMAHHDALTNLPNRALFRHEAEQALAEPDACVAVLTLDLDHFKEVNDSCGHPVGDQLLIRTADRLSACLQPGEFVARLGGDEFAVITRGPQAAQRAEGLAAEIIATLAEPFDIDGHHLVIGASVGVAVGPADGRDPDELLKASDIALYRAKSEGRAGCRFFEPGMDARMRERRQLEADLRLALVNGELEMHYQPLISLASNRVTAVEALMRWTHPTRGPVSPGEFIPLAEQIGLIGQLGAWALRQACADAASWPDHVRVAVNVSAAQLRADTLLVDVVAALAQSGLPARRLEIEITESVLLVDTAATLEKLQRLRSLGVHVAMDDFGTGYSSLSYLRRFPFDRIKIDQYFVRDLVSHEESAAIVRAIIGLGRSLRMDVTAEGVETEEQLALLRAEGCTDVQGWLFSKARPKTEIPPLLETIRPARAA